MVSKRIACGGLILVCWLYAVDHIDAMGDLGQVSEATQFTPAFFGVLTELEHQAQRAVST